MNLLYLLIAYLPIVSIVVGIALRIAGLVLHKSQKKLSKGLFIASSLCIGICVIISIALFLVGTFGIGPVPN